MDGTSRYRWFRSLRSPGVPLLALIVFLGVGGYLLTSTTIRHDRDEAAVRRARVEAVHTQEVLGRARAYVAGLADVLAREPEPGQPRFARWARATSASVGLNDVLWVEDVPASERRRYERLRGVPITRLTASGQVTRAPAAHSYLPATFTSQTRPELRPGIDVTGFPALDAAIRDRARIFAVGASRPGALGQDPGFYLLEAAGFGGRRTRRGYLVAFVPRGWFSTTLGGDPRRMAISEDRQRIEGLLGSAHASAGFEMLGRNWRIDVGREPPSGLQSTLPWLALAWPFAAAGIVLTIGHAITLRRRAQRDVERIFELSLDMICIAGFDGRFKAVNPAFERTLGYSRENMLARPFLSFVHPDDRQAAREAFAAVLGEGEVTRVENRYICADGSERWLEWSARAVPEQRVVHATARDVTERRRIDAEQAALRRVATLVAREAPQAEVFGVIADEIARLLGTSEIRMSRYDGDRSAIVVGSSGSRETFAVGCRLPLEGDNAAVRVLRTGRTARIDYATAGGPVAEAARAVGVRSAVGAPVLVQGRLWGSIVAGSIDDEPLPPETEYRLGQFTELMATAIANTEARASADRLADEQAALRRVATLVAELAPPDAVFDAVAAEMEALLDADQVVLNRFEAGDEILLLAHRGLDVERSTVGSRVSIEGESATAKVRRSRKPARMEGYESAEGPLAELARATGLRSSVSAPIMVERRLWGVITASWRREEPPPDDTAERMTKFTDLVATALANTESREALRRLAEEQSALRRVATLVAEAVGPAELFSAVTQEVARLFKDVEPSLVPSIIRFDPGPEFVLVGAAEPMLDLPIGSRWGPRDLYVSTRVFRTGRSAHVDEADVASDSGPDSDLLRRQRFLYQVGSPIIVEGQLWGAMTMNSTNALPADTGERLQSFTELVATAISNSQAREDLRRLADQQAALRRVATLVAEGASPNVVFDAVAAEMEALLDADGVTMGRFEPGTEVTFLAHRGQDAWSLPPGGTRWNHEGENVTSVVRRTGRPARIERDAGAEGETARLMDELGVQAAVGAPVMVEGRLWGVIIATWTADEVPPADAEERMGQFAQLIDTAVANADSRDQLNASRARLVTEGDDARRRVVRDLHDGAQQRLVHSIITLKLARQALQPNGGKAESLVAEALEHAERGNAELRELAHGLLPAALTRGGLRAGVNAVAQRVDLPVRLDVPADRFPADIEASAYFIVAEALTNVVKHAHAEQAEVRASVDGRMLRLEIRDDGIGGADPQGHGLVGIGDRVTALGGRLDVDSPPGGGTLVVATLPV